MKNKIKKLLNDIRSFARTGLKAAALGGEQDTPFEQAFSSLAHAYIKDKAPSLLDYEVGFQLLEKNPESTKAIGVFGFKVGNQWLMIPAFFLNGDLKGHELLYVKNQDNFVPAEEGWINYFLNRRPSVLGRSVDRNLRDIGVAPPNLYQLSRSPDKFASAMNKFSSWFKEEVLPSVASWIVVNPITNTKYSNIIDLPTFLKKEGKVAIGSLLSSFKDTPALAEIVDNLYGLKIVDDAINAYQLQKKAEESSSVINKLNWLLKKSDKYNSLNDSVGYTLETKLRFYTYDDYLDSGTSLADLNDKERSKLLNDRILIKDERDKANTAYEVESPVQLKNPSETGLYDVLVKSNEFRKCLIIFAPYSNKNRAEFITLVDIDGNDKTGRAWLNIHSGHIWVGHHYTKQEYLDWWNKLKEATDLPVGNSGLHVLIGNTGEGSLPFTVHKEVSTTSRKIYEVWFKRYAEKERPDHLPNYDRKYVYRTRAYDNFGNGCRIVLTGKRGARLRATGEELYVPTNYKLLVLRPVKDDDSIFGICGCDAHSEPSPIEPGNAFDLDLFLATKTASVKVFDTGTEVIVNDKRMPKLAALIHLVRDWGLREKQAREILKRAAHNKVSRFRVKKADPIYDLQKERTYSAEFPDAPAGYDAMTGGMVPTQYPGEWNMRIQDLAAGNTDRSLYHPLGPEPDYQIAPDRETQRAALQAGQLGQKEVFDTSMIGSLLNAISDDSMIDKYLGDLMKGLDRLGRILFLFYWHNEEFADRYGKSEMVELEDGLRRAFESAGKIILFLKQRAVQPNPDEERDVDLSVLSA